MGSTGAGGSRLGAGLGCGVRQFQWAGAGEPPRDLDLRRLGWRLMPYTPACVGPGLVLIADRVRCADWPVLLGDGGPRTERLFLSGFADPIERARLLRQGVGEVVEPDLPLVEIEARAWRLAVNLRRMPRFRSHGGLLLDLLARDGFIDGRNVGLHPREFALIWRLAECPGEAVTVQELLSDIWRLSYRPETNSLAVHISRLRAKLRISGLDGLIVTLGDGAYCLARQSSPFQFAPGGFEAQLQLDGYLRLREQRRVEEDLGS